MWIITHDNVHEAGNNPALTVPKSKDYLEGIRRSKALARKHVFRLMKGGRELFRGVAYFNRDATFTQILRPLDEYGRSLYDCDAIEYQLREIRETPTGRCLFVRVPEEDGRKFDELMAGKPEEYLKLLSQTGADFVCEITQEMLDGYIRMK